jgi:hypothetical protein
VIGVLNPVLLDNKTSSMKGEVRNMWQVWRKREMSADCAVFNDAVSCWDYIAPVQTAVR